MPTFAYSVANFVAFTKIKSADVNTRFQDIVTFLNTTKLDDDNIQNAGITRATKLKAGTASHVLINDGSGLMSSEAQLSTTRGGLGIAPTISSANAGKVIGVNDAGNALELRVGEAATLIEAFNNTVATLTAGEAITANDAVCLDLNEGAYKVFKASASSGTRATSCIGFASANVTCTPQITTIAITGTWTADSAAITVNGVTYTQAFSSNHNTSVDALCTAIQASSDVLSCVATGTTRNLITITGEGALTLTVTNTTQPTGATLGTPTTTQSPVGGNVRIYHYGPMSGFTSLVVGAGYYLSNTAGQISQTPGSTSVYLGQAISSTALLITPQKFNYSLTQSILAFKLNGGTTSNANPLQGMLAHTEQYNFTSWSAGTADSVNQGSSSINECQFNSICYLVDGQNDSDNAAQLRTRTFNKAAWSAGTTRATARVMCVAGVVNSKLAVLCGSTSFAASPSDAMDEWNGTTWSASSGFGDNVEGSGFTLSGTLHQNGINSGAGNRHLTWNGSSRASTTASTVAAVCAQGVQSSSSKGTQAGQHNSTVGQEWNGSSWASAAIPHIVYTSGFGKRFPTSFYYSGLDKGYMIGGTNGSNAAINTVGQITSSAWTAGTACNTAATNSSGAIF